MGVHVILDIVPQRIDPIAWTEAFDATARLLAAHPARLLGYGFRFVAGVRVPVFTRAVEQGAQDPAERRWCVVGDRASLGTGERQRMYRDLRRYAPTGAVSLAPADDVLVLAVSQASAPATPAVTMGGDPPYPPARPVEQEPPSSSPGTPPSVLPAEHSPLVRVFGEGEQSPSCQIALLAAAMVVESRFPGNALVSGCFDREKTEVARRWASGVLGAPVALPVRVDAWRLAERLGSRFAGKGLFRAVSLLYLAEPASRDAALATLFGRAARQGQEGADSMRFPPSIPPASCPASPAGEVPAIDALTTLTSPGELDADQRDRILALALAARRHAEEQGGPASAGDARRISTIGVSNRRVAPVASALARGGPTLTEDAWDWIEREEDPSVQGFLVALAGFEPGGSEQAALRRVLLENRALCRWAARWQEHPAPAGA